MGILRADRITGIGGANAIKGSVDFGSNDSQNYESILAVTNTSDLDIGAGNYTIEYWFNCVDPTADGFNTSVAQSEYTNGSANNAFNIYHYNTGLRIFNRTSSNFTELVSNSAKWIPGKWHHFAWVRSGTGTNENAIYVDGVSIATFTNALNYTSGQHWLIGGNFYTASNGYGRAPEYGWSGHLSNVRVSNIARYSGAFTPPTTEYAVDSNTILLACQSPGNVLQEATGKEVTYYKGYLASTPPKASRFTPNSPVGFSTTTDVGSQYGTTFNGFGNFATSTYMVPPGGNTRERNRGRALLGGGHNPSGATNHIHQLSIQSQGNTEDFGDLTYVRWIPAPSSSSTRGVWSGGGGYNPGSPTGSYVNFIDFVTISHASNATDFGDQTAEKGYHAGLSNETRGIIAGGYNDSVGKIDVIEYITIATAGNGQDFGDLTAARMQLAAAGSPTRGLFFGGAINPNVNGDVVDYITIATTGNAIDFGNMLAITKYGNATSSNTRAIYGGGMSPNDQVSSIINTIQYFTIATTGDATDFGDLTVARNTTPGATSDNTRGIFAGGYISGSNVNTMDYVTIATTGDALDFGDLTQDLMRGIGALSDGHGGLE